MTQPTHIDDAIQISLVLRGGLVERVGRTDEQAGALSLVVKARGVEHADWYGAEGAVLVAVALRGDAGERLVDRPDGLPAWRWTHGTGPLRPLLQLSRRLSAASAVVAGDDPDLLALLAAVTRRDDEPAPRGSAPAWLDQVRQRLDEEPGLRVAQVARDAGVHPVYLARCFRRWFGCSVATALQRARLRRAAALLPDPSRTLAGVACEAGFTDQAHLNHRFRALTGLPPGRYRGFLDRSAPVIDYRERLV